MTICDRLRHGMSAALLSRLFEVFAQDTCSLDRSFGGLGIGLSFARHITRMYGGSITAPSNGPGTGSAFSLTLPAVCNTALVELTRFTNQSV